MIDYDERIMRRLVGGSDLYEEFAEMTASAKDYGKAALRQLFDKYVERHPEITTAYIELTGLFRESPKHVRRETPVTRTIEIAIALYGWRGFIEGLELYALNKGALLREVGVPQAAEAWEKVADRARTLPKNPQL